VSAEADKADKADKKTAGRAGRWLTLPGGKRVLVVVHTEVYGQRLRDLFRLLEGDLRLELTFTVAPHAFNDGAERFLQGLGARWMPWKKAVRTDFDLALAAGSRGMEQVRAPLIRLPHGAGHIKLSRERPRNRGADRTVSGLGREYLTHLGKVVPAAFAVAHDEDRAALARSCPEALAVTEVVGDPCFDRIQASLPMREGYRRALGLREGERLVLACSTWGLGSSFNRLDALLPRLLAELPRPEFRTAVLVHPNVWAGHGSWQVRAWLSACRRHGVTVIGPEADWRALLVAADCVIGDHGSVTLYGTMTGAPILLARYPDREVNPASPAAALAAAAPALSPAHPLTEQLDYAAAEYPRQEYARIAARLSSEPGRFNRNMRRLMYRLLALGQPAYSPATEPVPLPEPLAGAEVTA
jgi:hypothetical protein